MSSKKVTLPEIPKGKDLEDFVSAFYQVAGFYVERSIIHREEEEILELDVLTTGYDVTPPNILLTEVKSGGWGFSDLFKLSGWLRYLKLTDAVFVATKSKDHLDFYCNKARELGIKIVTIPDLEDAAKPLFSITSCPTPDLRDVAIWRFSYWLDRVLGSEITRKKRESISDTRYIVLAEYLHAINSSAFFQQTISERMSLLSEEYKRHPNLSARVSAEMKGEPFDNDCFSVDQDHYKAAFYKCEYNDLQLSTYVEHRSRLALMKYATDFVLYSKAGRLDIAKDTKKIEILGRVIEFSSFEDLPPSFRNGIETIKDEPYFHRYPIFWQWFMWVYGGFILLDKAADEMAHMSARTGIPVSEITRALKAYDILFPVNGAGWFVDASPKARIQKLKLFPIPFMGLGAHYRRRIYCGDKDLASLPVTGQFTISDLSTWVNMTIELLSK